MYRRSSGLFDITSGVFRRIWDFKNSRLPTEAERQAILPLVGWDRVEWDDGGIYLPKEGMEIDFGGFGKEYACDRAAQVLRDAGVVSGLVNLSGDVVAIGEKPNGAPWEIGIQHPRKPSTLLAKVPLADAAVATSGDYERFFEKGGIRYCHLLNPSNGQSVHYWQSVSVAGPSCLAAGALASVVMLAESDGERILVASGLPFLALDRHERLISQQSK